MFNATTSKPSERLPKASNGYAEHQLRTAIEYAKDHNLTDEQIIETVFEELKIWRLKNA